MDRPSGFVDARGARKNGIENTRDRMVGRGVLLDVARLKGVPALEDGYAITNDDLDATARQAATGRFVALGDGVTHYDVSGPHEGPTVVLVHGTTTPAMAWIDSA